MKIPEPAFTVLNVFLEPLLKSPLRGLVSDSILLINNDEQIREVADALPVSIPTGCDLPGHQS